jgi:uncharacterized membrane protein YqaE (UPF0057 family)
MIQRIQSIYLLISSLGFGALFLFPFATSNNPVPQYLQDMVYNVQDSPILMILTVLGILIALVAIFVYNNRNLQQKLSILLIICSVFIPLVAVLLMYNEGTAFNQETTIIEDEAGIYMPIVSLLFAFLAYRGIKQDDKLVKSMDRLR